MSVNLVCKRCNLENLTGSLTCARCGAMLADDLTTKQIEPGAKVVTETWGASHFGKYFRVRFEIGDGVRQTVDIESELVLGRGEDVFDLTDYDGVAKGVSRRHAALRRVADGLTIRDLGSSNGTYQNGKRLEAQQYNKLADGDRLDLGGLKIRIFWAV